VFGPRKQKIRLSELAALTSLSNKPLTARGNINVKERVNAVCFFAQAAEVEVDPETGQVKVLKITSAHDVGTIINPLTHLGQVEGGMVQGFGFALMENLADEDGKILTNNLGEYKLPNIQDIPRHEIGYVRDDNGPGPFQAKPIGEHGAIPTAAAIGNAVYDAIGVQIMDLPITAEKIYNALQAKKTVTKI
jgi:CO/xanthine dehydrogenase Mo-binding subunit